MGFQAKCHLNKKLVPFKLHFFFAIGGFAGVMPFLPLIAKHLGIHATAVGIGYSMIPIFIFLSNPVFGLLVDYFQNIKVFLVLFLICGSVSLFSLLFLPPINFESEKEAYIRVVHFNESEPLVNLSMPFKRTCLNNFLERDINCSLVFDNKETFCQNDENIPSNITNSLDIVYNGTLSEGLNKMPNTEYWVTFYTYETSMFDVKCEINSSTTLQCIPNIQQCLIQEKQSSIFSTYQYWTFVTLAILGSLSFISLGIFSSVACYEALGSEVEAYGRQRLFGTISWGLICPLSGLLNDNLLTSGKHFTAGFYIMAIFVLADIVTLRIIQLPKANYSTNMCRDLAKVVKSKKILSFAFGVVITGFLNSIIAVYEFWFLTDMGASRTLLGLTIAMQCLVGEVPFLFFSGWFVQKLGHFLCLVVVFSGFTLRLLLYSLIKNPWLVLPVDILHGVTFGIYHGAMTSFAKVKAPQGMEATLQGIFGGLYDGLGYGIGSFVGGIGLDYLGPRKTFSSASILSFGALLLFAIASFIFRDTSEKKASKVHPRKEKHQRSVPTPVEETAITD